MKMRKAEEKVLSALGIGSALRGRRRAGGLYARGEDDIDRLRADSRRVVVVRMRLSYLRLFRRAHDIFVVEVKLRLGAGGGQDADQGCGCKSLIKVSFHHFLVIVSCWLQFRIALQRYGKKRLAEPPKRPIVVDHISPPKY